MDDDVETLLEEIEFQLPGHQFRPARLRLAIQLATRSAGVGKTIEALVRAMTPEAREAYREACEEIADTELAKKALIKA